MSPTVVRLALMGSRRSWGRLAGIVAGVAVGVALFLLLFGAAGALQERSLRSSWLNPNGTSGTRTQSTVLASSVYDRHDGATISRLDVSAPADSTVQLPGIPSAPTAGEFYASPALIERIESVPGDELGDRFGTLVGTLPDSVLMGPDSLVAVVGQPAEVLEGRDSTVAVTEFTATVFGGSLNYHTVAIIGGIAVLFPVLLLVSIVTGLGAAERRERFATLRLIGAAPGTVTRIAAIETGATSLVGAVVGVVLAAIFAPLAATLSIDGATFFVADLAVSPLVIAAAVVVTVVASTLVAAHRVARAGIGPLGAARQQVEKRPRAWRLIPLALGLAMMVGSSVVGQLLPELALRVDLLILGSFVLLTVGLMIAGPYLTVVAATLAARKASTASGVIATNRILRTPVATFRSVSGLVIAVFMVSVFAGAATTAAADVTLGDGPGLLPSGSLVANLYSTESSIDVDQLERVDGVVGVAELYSAGDSSVMTAQDAELLGLEDIPSTEFVQFSGNFHASDPSELVMGSSAVDSVQGMPVLAIVTVTDGSVAAIERARTWLELTDAIDLGMFVPDTRADAVDTAALTMVNSFATLAYLGVGIAILVAGASLAVATVAAVLDRRRVLGLLRLIGMPVASMRRIVVCEAAVPLLAVMALSVGLGLISAWVILTGLTEGGRTLGWPDVRYYVALGGSLLLALGAVAATFGTIRRNTAISSTRFE